jgi:flagellar protein FliS
MYNQKGYALYKSNKILTSNPAELTLMLYEGAIKFGNKALEAMENKNPAKAHENIVKV